MAAAKSTSTPGVKRCPQCKTEKPIAEFTTRTGNIAGWCKPCARKKGKAHYQKNPKAHYQAHKKWVAKNREKAREYSRKYHNNNKDKEKSRAKEFKRRNPHYHRDVRLRHFYGIGVKEYAELLAKQNGVCAICATDKPGSKFKHMLVDHDHETGRIRGLLCNDCNLILGNAKDSSLTLLLAIKYLEGAKDEAEREERDSLRRVS